MREFSKLEQRHRFFGHGKSRNFACIDADWRSGSPLAPVVQTKTPTIISQRYTIF
jgi:hypothetical protein